MPARSRRTRAHSSRARRRRRPRRSHGGAVRPPRRPRRPRRGRRTARAASRPGPPPSDRVRALGWRGADGSPPAAFVGSPRLRIGRDPARSRFEAGLAGPTIVASVRGLLLAVAPFGRPPDSTSRVLKHALLDLSLPKLSPLLTPTGATLL